MFSVALLSAVLAASTLSTHAMPMSTAPRRRLKSLASFRERAASRFAALSSSSPGGASTFDGNEGNEGDEGDEGGVFSITSGTTVSSASCTATASSGSFSEAKDVHISAMADMALLLCSRDAGTAVGDSILDDPTDAGYALAHAFADAQAACVSAGNAFACATAFATARAWAEASLEAHVTAVAEAVVQFGGEDASEEELGACATAGCDAEALAYAVGSSDLFVDLMAEVFSVASAAACAVKDADAVAYAFRSCLADAYAQVWTKAWAEAMANTGCLSPDASAVIIAEIEISVSRYEVCVEDTGAHGLAGAVTIGSADTDVTVP